MSKVDTVEATDSSLYFIDEPCDEERDAIGYSTYVDSLQEALNSSARIIGIVSNYGAGKSTIIKMLEDRENSKSSKNTAICRINLWNLPSGINSKNKDDITINIHKSFLNQLINDLNFDSYKKKALQKQTNKNYGFLDIVPEDKKFTIALYILLSLIVLTVIMSVDLFELNVPRIALLILEAAVAINIIYLLIKSKIYFSFNKETKNNREIDEFETIDCFKKIIESCNSKRIKRIIICVEDIDRFTNETDAIRFLEQIYKFYIESIRSKEIEVKFIITIMPASNFNNNIKKHSDNIKNIYEKIFDFIINLQPVSIQNYDALLLELLKPKKNMLSAIGLNAELDDKGFYWTYLYKGKSVTIRDIKHRYNYAISLYTNLLNHKLKDETTKISVESCFYVSYLEDEFSDAFYTLIENSYDFENMVMKYLTDGNIYPCSICKTNDECPNSDKTCRYIKQEEFINNIKYGFENNLIDATYSMYFYKFPKGKEIKNIYDQGINNALYRDDILFFENFDEYATKCSENEINATIDKLVEMGHIPSIIFKNKRLLEITYDRHIVELERFILSYDIKSQNKKTLQMLEDLKNIGGEKAIHCIDRYIKNIVNNVFNSLEDSKIIELRTQLLTIIKNYYGIYVNLYSSNLPMISLEEMKIINDINKVLNLLKIEDVDADIVNYLGQLPLENLKSENYLDFIEKVVYSCSEQLENIIYLFNPEVFKLSKNYKYKISNNDTIINVLDLASPAKLLRFCQFYNFIPSNLDILFTTNVVNLPQQEQDELVKVYVSLIKKINHISVNELDFLDNFHTKYSYTNEIEQEMISKKKYKLYIYSKTARTSLFDVEPDDRMVLLNGAYIYYFNNSNNLGKSVKATDEVLKYLYPKIDLSNLPINKRILFNQLPQKLDEVKIIINNKDNEYINTYLKSIIEFDRKDIADIFDIIYDWGFEGNNMHLGTYNHLKNVIDKKRRTKFGALKSQRKLVN